MNDERSAVAALAALDHMTTARLRSLLAHRSAVDAYAIAAGDSEPRGPIATMFDRQPELRDRWRRSALDHRPDVMGRWCDELGVAVVLPSDDHFPAMLLDDPQGPAVLFVRGDLGALDARRIGIVGTRNPTQHGLQTAAHFGHDLAAGGVTVVSGLAKGIDGAAHRGALASAGSRPVAVVANGHDQPYPKRHHSLWREVGERGAVISEWPPGTTPDAFRFPQRNRILAALSEIVLVVESRERGGSLITAQLAAERGIDVFAVPGPLHSRSSLGTNRLIQDGAAVAAEPDDLLLALGLDGRRSGSVRHDARPRPRGFESRVLEFCRTAARDVDAVAHEFDCSMADAAMALARLERSGWLRETGGWFEMLDEWAALL